MTDISRVKEIIDVINERFPGELDADGSNVIQVIISKLVNYSIMTTEVYEDVKATQLFAENTFLIGQWNHLQQVEAYNAAVLQKSPGDIKALGKIARVQHDLDIIRKASQGVNAKLCDLIEQRYAGNKPFKYLPTTKNSKDA